MQCSVLTEYRIGAIGLPMLSSRLSAACGSFMTKQPPSASAAWIRSSTPVGSTWSWIASNTNTTSNGCVDLEPGRVADLEAHVGESGAAGLGAGPRDRAVVEVVADERRRGERPGQQHERVPGAARDVGDARARVELLGEPGHEREVRVDQQRVVGAAPDRVHHVGELGPVRGVGNAAAFAKRARDLVHVLAEMRVQQRHRRQVRRRRRSGTRPARAAASTCASTGS